MPHDHHDNAHDHDHLSPSGHPYRPDQDTGLSYWQSMEIAIRELLIEKGITTAEEIAQQIDAMDSRSPSNGAAVVARAWTDPAFKQRLLADGSAVSREMGFDIGPMHLIAVENTADVHNVIVCTLCSCYPRNLLGLPPDWYKSRAYRSRTVKEPRKVLSEFGLSLPDTTTVRVHDSTADMRYIVLPARPEGSEGLDAEALAALVTRDSMIGTGLPRRPGVTDRQNNLTQGILWILAAMFLVTAMDAMAKEVAHRTDTVMAIWARYMGRPWAVTLLVLPRLRQVAQTKYPKLQFLRSVLLLAATCCLFFGVVLVGLGNAAAVMSLNPVLITLGGALILGETFGLRRALGIAAALIGALIIIRPGAGVFDPASILPLGAAVFLSGYALATRFVGRDEDVWTSLLYTAAFGALVISFVVPFFWVRPDPIAAGLMLILGSVGAAGHFCMIRAYMAAEASAVAPFSYVGLVFSIIWGMVFFAEYPPWTTYLGALVIVLAGLYVWHRETRVKPRSS